MPLSALEVLVVAACCCYQVVGYIYGCVVHVYVNSFVKVALALLCDHEGTLKYREYKLYIHDCYLHVYAKKMATIMLEHGHPNILGRSRSNLVCNH